MKKIWLSCQWMPRWQIREQKSTMDYLETLCDQLLDIYFNPRPFLLQIKLEGLRRPFFNTFQNVLSFHDLRPAKRSLNPPASRRPFSPLNFSRITRTAPRHSLIVAFQKTGVKSFRQTAALPRHVFYFILSGESRGRRRPCQ